MDPAWTAPAVATLHDLYELPTAHTGRSAVVHSDLPQAEYHSNAPWAPVRHAPVQGDAMDSCLTSRVAQHAAHLGGCALSQCGGLARTPGDGRPAPAVGRLPRGRWPSGNTHSGPPLCHDGTERPMPRPHDPAAQKTCDRGKKKRHMLKNLLLINGALRILFLSET